MEKSASLKTRLNLKKMPKCLIVLTDLKYDKTISQDLSGKIRSLNKDVLSNELESKNIESTNNQKLSTTNVLNKHKITQSTVEKVDDIKRTHNEKIYKCLNCFTKFLNQKSLDEHKLTHSDVERKKKYTCYVCMLKFPIQEELDKHKEDHVELELKKVQPCQTRMTKLQTQKALDEQTLIESDIERKKNYTCYICMSKFETQDDLDDHKSSHSVGDNEDDLFEEDYVPTLSGKFTEEDESGTEEKVKKLDVLLKNPAEKPRRGRKKRRKEDEKSSSKKDDKPSETKKEEKENVNVEKVKTPFKCDTCNVFFETSDDAKSHISPNKCKFSCHLCNRKFNTLYAFIVHVMQHKNNSVKSQTVSKSLYACNSCNKHFDDCFQLKRHEISVHNKKTSTEPVTTQTTEVMMTEVMMTEVIVRPDADLTCELCYDIFNTKEELDNHTEFHKQIEETEPFSPTTNTETTVEVVDDNTNKHDIITTIQAKTIPSVYGKKYVTNPAKKNLTATIKDMISPNESKPKQSKIIFLPNIEEEKLQQKKKKNRSKNVVFNIQKPSTLNKPQDNETQPSQLQVNPSSLLKTPTVLNRTIASHNAASSSYATITPITGSVPSYSSNSTATTATAGSTTRFAYIIIPNTSMVPANSVGITEDNQIISETLPRIESVVSLNDATLKNITDESNASIPQMMNQESIVIDDSDSEAEEKNDEKEKKNIDSVDSDEESNLVIDEKNIEEPKSQDREIIKEEEVQEVQVEESSQSKEYICTYCNFSCIRIMELKKHYLQSHKAFLCWKCQFLTMNIGEFIEHRNVHTLRDC